MTTEIHLWTGVSQQRLLMELIWPIARIMTNWRQYLRDVVMWNGKQCVWDVTPLNTKIELINAEDETKKELTRGTSQWVAIWAGKIAFSFNTHDMQGI